MLFPIDNTSDGTEPQEAPPGTLVRSFSSTVRLGEPCAAAEAAFARILARQRAFELVDAPADGTQAAELHTAIKAAAAAIPASMTEDALFALLLQTRFDGANGALSQLTLSTLAAVLYSNTALPRTHALAAARAACAAAAGQPLLECASKALDYALAVNQMAVMRIYADIVLSDRALREMNAPSLARLVDALLEGHHYRLAVNPLIQARCARTHCVDESLSAGSLTVACACHNNKTGPEDWQR